MGKHKSLRLLIVAGDRPNLMKIGPLIEAVNKHNVRSRRKIEKR